MRLPKRMLLWIAVPLGAAAALAAAAAVILSQPEFGAAPDSESKKLMASAPNFRDGRFENLEPTRVLLKEENPLLFMVKNLFRKKPENLRPAEPLPAVKTDFASLPSDKNTLVWLGHGSFYLSLTGTSILADPVFSDYGAPFSFANRAFPGTTPWSTKETPVPDILLLTHDHWDHLDYESVKAMAKSGVRVIVPLGVGADFRRWGFAPERVTELGWHQSFSPEPGLRIICVPSRHFSGRTLSRNGTLWAGYVIERGPLKIYLSGDSGFGRHFEEIGRRYGPFDWAALDSGQYDPRWAQIHMTPEEAVRAAKTVGARRYQPAHIGRFALAAHPWRDPFERAEAAAEKEGVPIAFPKIGEPVDLGSPGSLGPWWKTLR